MAVGFFISLAHDLDDDLPFPGSRVKIDEDNLLPGAQGHPPGDQRYGQRSLEQSRPDVAVAIPIMPGFIMQVCVIAGYQFIKYPPKILNYTRLKL